MLMKTTFAEVGWGEKRQELVQCAKQFQKYDFIYQKFIAGVRLGLKSRTRGQ